MKLDDFPTPALVLDRHTLSANTSAMTERMRRHDVRLRPHMKTAKSAEVARLALKDNFGGITVRFMELPVNSRSSMNLAVIS